MKTADLTGAALDYWVAKALGLELCRREDLGLIPVHPSMKREVLRGILTFADEERLDEMFDDAMRERTEDSYFRDWNPSTDWKQGGPIIERERIAVVPYVGRWAARKIDLSGTEHFGPTPLISGMRAFVSAKFGEDVDATA